MIIWPYIIHIEDERVGFVKIAHWERWKLNVSAGFFTTFRLWINMKVISEN